MANSPTDFNLIDRLSNLPNELLITILSFLPTRIAAQTSVLCRRFRHLWEASPSLVLISQDFRYLERDFVSIAKRLILHRHPSHPLLSLHLEISRCHSIGSFLSSLLSKACYLDLRHLTIEGYWFSSFFNILPNIFTINSLRYLSIDIDDRTPFKFPSGIPLTCLKSLSLTIFKNDLANLNPLLSELCSLEDLHLHIKIICHLNLPRLNLPRLSISSQTIRKLKLIIGVPQIDKVELSLPSLESLHLEIQDSFRYPSHIHGEFPLLRKVVINFYELHERDVNVVARLLNCISHVEELSLHIKESKDVKYPIPILLESGKNVPKFSNLKHLDATLCFHGHNFEAVTSMLNNCPILKSLKLVHEIPEFNGLARGRKRKDWASKLPRNADYNYRYAYLRNLHLEEDRKKFMKLLSKKGTSKRQARN